MVYFLTKNANFGIFFEGLGMENVGALPGHLVFLLFFSIVYGNPVGFWPFWYIFPEFVFLHQEKSGNLVSAPLCDVAGGGGEGKTRGHPALKT
jgi:hypothetical protein